MRRKRKKQLIAILLSIIMITLATTKPYQEARATGLEAGGAAAGALMGLTFGEGVLIGTGIAGGIILMSGMTMDDVKDLYEAGKRGDIQKAAEKSAEIFKNDFVNYSTQALNNNVSAAEQERDNAAHARSVIEDWLETASAGVIDTSSEAWDWFRNFVSDIRNALSGEDDPSHATIGGYPVFEDGTYYIGRGATRGMGWHPEMYLIIEGAATTCANAVLCRDDVGRIQVRDYLTGHYIDGAIETLKVVINNVYDNGKVEKGDPGVVGKDITNFYNLWNTAYEVTEWNIPQWGYAAAPGGTTDVPGVSNVNDYVSIGSDLPYTRPEGAWDICDPNGKKGQVSIGQDIPANLGYDDWYDVLGGIANGDTTWEEVANASDVIILGSDTATDYNPDNADAWDAYHDGVVTGYDVDAAGNVTITFEDGTVIGIPQDRVGDIEWTNEQDKAQELDKDTDFPVSGTLAYPLPIANEVNPPADPDPGGSGGSDIKVDTDASDYTLDFRKLFPFCIPFDIYKAVKLLDASPTAPVVHYKFYLSKSKTYTIDLNLNKFNTVAAILRRMECLLFIIGLATATRRIYIRG